MKKKEQDKIIFSAIKTEKGKVYFGKRHHEVILKMRDAGCDKKTIAESTQGFYTEKGKFLDREESAKLALKNGQIRELRFSSRILFSEDLW